VTLRLELREGDDVRCLWLASILVLAFGAWVLNARYERSIAAAHEQTEYLYRETVANRRTISQAAALHAIERQAREDIGRISHERSLSTTTAELLDMLHHSSRDYRTQILGVVPTQTSAAAGHVVEESRDLLATHLTIRAGGSFKNILVFVENLSHQSTLLDVADVELALAGGADQNVNEPDLEATIHATLYRLMGPTEEPLVVPAR
jgi:hypothetical protein